MKITTLASHIHMPLGVTFYVYQTQDPEAAAKRHQLLRGSRPEEVVVCNTGYCLVPVVKSAGAGKGQK